MTFSEYMELKKIIKVQEAELFKSKKRLKELYIQDGKIHIEGSIYNCNTCKNTSCLNYAFIGKEGTIIRNHTRACGCLDWLPKDSVEGANKL